MLPAGFGGSVFFRMDLIFVDKVEEWGIQVAWGSVALSKVEQETTQTCNPPEP